MPILHRQPGRPASDPGLLVFAGRVRLRHRVAARVRSRRFDALLGAGVPSEASPALSVRARQLTAPRHRRLLAGTYQRIVREARDGVPRPRSRVTPCHGQVRAASDALGRLAEILAAPGPVAARGAAEARLLLTDGTGPLYNARSEVSLLARVLRATDSLALTGGPLTGGR